MAKITFIGGIQFLLMGLYYILYYLLVFGPFCVLLAIAITSTLYTAKTFDSTSIYQG